MPANWLEYSLGDLCSEITVGHVGSMTNEYRDSGIPFFRSKNIREYRIDWDDVKYISQSFHEKLKKSTLRPGDVAVVRTGKPGTACVIPDYIDEANCSDLVIMRVNPQRLSAYFLSYYLNSVANHQINSQLVGAVQQHFNVGAAKKLSITIPDRNEQERIVKVVKDLDDKIQLNHQINQTLEQMAQAIFKSWFVDFEPVKAKIAALKAGGSEEDALLAAMQAISGKGESEITRLQAEQPEQYAELRATAELFPSAMQESELGEIPEGWGVSQIGDEVTVVGGGTPSTKNPDFWNSGEINWTSPKDLSNLADKVLVETERKVTEAGLAKISSGLLPVDTVLMSSRAPVGYLALAKIPVAVNQGYIAMKCEKALSPEFVIQWCAAHMDEIKSRASGTTFAEISKKNFKIIPVVMPTESLISIYSKQASSLYEAIENNVRESDTLAKLRDSLLPKLLSGELSVSDVESHIADEAEPANV